MEIRRASERDIPAVKALWAYAFERPGDPFFEWYFGNLRAEDVLLGIVGKRVACDLHLRPYTLSVRGKVMDADYIVGVATHPAARGRGMASELLREAFRASRAVGKAVDILMPSSADFYFPFGFAFYAHQWKRETAPEKLSALSRKPEKAGLLENAEGWRTLADIYDAYIEGRTGFALRDEISWKRHIEGWLTEAYIAVVSDETGPAGYLVYTLADGTLTVSEFCFKNERGRGGLYAFLAGHAGQAEKIRWQEAEDDRSYLYWNDGAEHTYIENRTFPFMMGRVTDLEAAFTGLPAGNVSGNLIFRYEDGTLPENVGLYELSAEAGRMSVRKKGKGNPEFSLTPAGAVQLLFGAVSAEELFRYGKAEWEQGRKKETAEVLNALFPRQACWVNEWY